MSAPAPLEPIRTACWAELARAAAQREHEWRTPVLATQGGEGADARVVVLREVDAAAGRLVVYSDARAAKVAQLRAAPRALLVFWSPRLRWQLRVRVLVQVDDDGLAVASRWAQLRLSPAARDYLSPLPPGAELESPGEVAATLRPELGRLAVLQAQVTSIDWLELRDDGHRRARFDDRGARWLQA